MPLARKPSIRKSARSAPTDQPQPVTPHGCEADVAEGLEWLARDELRAQLGDRIEFTDTHRRPGVVRFSYTGNLYPLLKQAALQSVYLARYYPVPRPKALLGDQHFKAWLEQIRLVRDLSPADAYRTFYISAAGSESSVMQRIKAELGKAIGLEHADEEGDLLIRLRRPLDRDDGWEVLVRLTPRPLATRPWRVCNREGALNATVAHAVVALTSPTPEDSFLNIACGSGTLLIERLAYGPAHSLVGYDSDEAALECARQNVAAAGYAEQIKLNLGDARSLPLPGKSVDVICADLPFGHLIGSHDQNVELYPELLREAGRVAKPGARCVLVTHEVRLMERLLDDSHEWQLTQTLRVALGGLNPRIFVLERR
jgi:23S rRNA G2445 N2-methylase RlmL